MERDEKGAGAGRPVTARRDFLRLAGFGGIAAGTAVLAAAPAEAEAAAPEARTGAGYRETAHVRKVYETARF